MRSSIFVALTLVGSGTAAAAETVEMARAELPTVTVIGSPEASGDLPGSGAYISREDFTRQGYDDIHRILQEIPGVYVRGEDGYGLFPNISLRGADPGRSAKLTLMEDGILMAPAPYAAPSAYYSPTAGRMHALEVLKGSSQVRFGPHATGGVVNYLSTPVPEARQGYLRSAYGSDNEYRNQLWLGDQIDSPHGRIGYLVEVYHRQTDGFKDITGPLSGVGPDAGNSGFTRIEPLVKLAFEPAGDLQQRIELVHGRSRLDADETYLGISSADFRRNPNQRYAASQFDNIRTEQQRSYLRYSLMPGPATSVVATVYRTDFARNWDKIRQVNGVGLGRALAQAGDDLATLRGERAGEWGYRDNNRKYYGKGAELLLTQDFATGGLEHTLKAGVRLHQDGVTRFQHNTTYVVNDDGLVTERRRGAPGSQDNRTAEARALSVYLEDTIRIGDLSLVPGVRVENIDWTTIDRRGDRIDNPVRATGDESYTSAGLGFNYMLGATAKLFGGVYQGISPPSPGDGINGVDAEESLSAELGLRLGNGSGLMQELVVFATDFENLVVTNNLGASGSDSGATESVGEVETYGVEYLARTDLLRKRGGALRMPLSLSLTYTSAEIANDSSAADDAESIFSGGRSGAKLPYVPEWQASLSLGLAKARWSVDARVSYMDATFATALNTRDEVVLGSDGSLVADARGGMTDSHVVVDLSARFALSQSFGLFANVHNLFDEDYIASRLPEGPRPGLPLTALIGVEAALF